MREKLRVRRNAPHCRHRATPDEPVNKKLSVSGQSVSLPLRWYLVLLVVGTLLPAVVFGAALLLRLASEEQDAAERRLAHSARVMAASIERELSSNVRTLRALAESEYLDQDDLKAFHAQAMRVQSTQPGWLTVLLLNPDGRQLVNSARPWGTSLTGAQEPDSLRAVVKSGRPVVGRLARGKRGNWAFPVRVPIKRAGEIRYVLTAAVTWESLADVVAHQLPPQEEWTRVIVDQSGRIAARTRNPEQWVGQLGTPSFIQRSAASAEGVYRDRTMEGTSVYVAFSRVPGSGWTAAVTAPVLVVEKSVRSSLAAVLVLGLVLLLASGAGAFYLSRHVSQGIISVAAAAEALAHGARPVSKPAGITEVARLGEALERSAALLQARERERDEHLHQAEAARAEAEAASRAKDEFLAMLGHELRNPLSPILTAVEIMKLRQAGQPRELGVIERQAHHLTRLVDDLLDVSRITRGKIELRKESVDLAGVVARALEMVNPLLEQREHEVAVVCGCDALRVVGDPVRLAQVMANLLTNAARYTEPGGRIEVVSERKSNQAVIRVKDNGQGLAADLLPRVFDLFVQGPRALARQEGGLGIGLTLVRSLVEMHGGTVEVSSDGLGKGSTFTVRLPLADTV